MNSKPSRQADGEQFRTSDIQNRGFTVVDVEDFTKLMVPPEIHGTKQETQSMTKREGRAAVENTLETALNACPPEHGVGELQSSRRHGARDQDDPSFDRKAAN